MKRIVRPSSSSFLGVVLLAVGLLGVILAGVAAALSGGVSNPGYETVTFNSAMVSEDWLIVSQPAPGTVAMRQQDDASEYAVFGDLGTTVAPRTGDWMLRFGFPKGTDSHQLKGVTKITQRFLSDGTDIGVAFRFFTWEHKADDAFIVDVKRADGTSVGRLGERELQDIRVTSLLAGGGPLPYTIDLLVEPRQLKCLDTGWQDVRITDLAGTAGQELTISFTLDTNTDAAHDSWVYLDLADIVRPVVTIAAPADGSTVSDTTPTLEVTAVDETWGSGLAASPEVWLDGVKVAVQSGESLPQLADGAHTVLVTAVDKAGNRGTATATFTVQSDVTPPTVSINSPVAGSTTGYNRPVLTFTTSDGPDGSGMADEAPEVTLDGQPLTATSGELLPQLEDGTHTLVVTAADRLGNVGSATATFTVAAPVFAVQPESPHEGDAFGLYADATAATGNPDGSTEGKRWEWRISEGDSDPVTYEGPMGFIVPDGVTTYEIQLTVTDVATGSQCITSRSVTTLPQAARVNVLDVDVLAGGPTTLVARFLDPGWTDTHSATWTVPGAAVAGDVLEDHVAAMDSGFISGTTAAVGAVPGALPGSLAVTDSDGQVTNEPFVMNVVADDPRRDEGPPDADNDHFASATILKSDQAHLSYIQSAGDVDVFEVRMPDGALLPYGTEVLVTLRDLPADFDVAVIHDLGPEADTGAQPSAFQSSSFASSPYRNTPYRNTPYRNTPYRNTPYRNTPYLDTPYRNTPFEDVDFLHTPYRNTPYRNTPYRNTPYRNTPYRNTPFLDTPYRNTPYPRSPFLDAIYVHTAPAAGNSLAGYSFLDMDFTGLNPDRTSGGDIIFEELGFDNEEVAGKLPAGFSAASGTETEVVLAVTEVPNGKTYIAVKGANGAFSTEPYTLQVETSAPFDALAALDLTPLPPLVENGSTTTTEAIPAPASGPETLFVTQSERMEALYPGQWESVVLPALQRACASDLVRGKVISVPASLYGAWDAEPWKPDLANQVAEGIRAEIERHMTPSIKYVVLVGSDEVVPQRRVPDQTVLGNERIYADTSFLRSDSPLFASMYRSMILTDDYYVDAQPIDFNGRPLYIPDIAVSRLVETPAQIAFMIDTFLAQSASKPAGQLAAATSVVTGQDFMIDGAQQVNGILTQAGLQSVLLSGPDWSAYDLREALLDDSRDVADVNAHFTHFGGISALAYGQMLTTPAGEEVTWDPAELFTGRDIAGASDFVGRLIFSMGCHAGLNVPDDQALPLDVEAYGVDPSVDIAEAVAAQGGVLVASTGYGFGDTATIAGSEALVGLFADQITTEASPDGDGQPIGLALAAAKRQYLGSLSAVTAYDEKSSIEFTMYGMPQYRLPSTAARPASDTTQTSGVTAAEAAALVLTEPSSITFPTSFELSVIDGATTTHSSVLEERLIDGSRYITADGDCQATADRPIQPRVVIDLGPGGDNPVNGVIVTGGTYVDIPHFDPAISRWTTEWEADVEESQVSTDGWWPANPVTVSTIDSPDGREQRLIVLPGQFLSTSALDEPVSGTERVWTSLEVTLVRGPAATATSDAIRPTVSSVILSNQGDTWTATVDASDASGIARIDVTQVGTEVTESFSFSSPTPVVGTTYNVSFDLPTVSSGDVEVMVSVVDGAGNVTTANAKGVMISGPPEGTMTLNGGAASSYNSIVRLDSEVLHAVEMRTSTDGGVTWSAWRPYEARCIVALPGLPGDKTVRVEYRNADPSTLLLTAAVRLEAPPTAAGSGHNIAKVGGSVWGWGWNTYGQVGDGSTLNRLAPVRVGAEGDWTVVEAGENHSLAIKSDGSLWTWGHNDNGQLGDGTLVHRAEPVRVGLDNDWIAVDAGYMHSLAIKTDGSLWAWGNNVEGQLGDGTQDSHLTPVRIGLGDDWAWVEAGYSHSLAIKTDGSLWAWGGNWLGQLGDGTTFGRWTPVRIGHDSDWATIDTQQFHSLALRTDGSLWAWGWNINGQLGDGTSVDRLAPVRVGLDSDWVGVEVGDRHSLALKADGSLWAWGLNQFGQLGDGTTTDRLSPIRVGSDGDWGAVEAGSQHSLAIKTDGSLWAWGWNYYGQLGDGTATASSTPKQVFDLLATPVPPTVTSPNGSVSWVIGSTQEITWTPGNGAAVNIGLSRDGGASWETLYASAGNDGSESWTVSGPASSQALVRVSNDAGLDISDDVFQIGLFAAKTDYATDVGPNSVIAGDFNGDGKQDLATANYNAHSVSVLLGDGSGGFAAKIDYATGMYPISVIAGDFNGDGKRDLATANVNGNSVSVLLGDGSGAFAAKTDYATAAGPLTVAAGDVNGDGRQDLVTANQDDSVSVLLGDGSGGFAAKTDYATGSYPSSVAVGDFNGDGRQDLATANYYGNSVSVLLGDGSGAFAAKTDYATGAGPLTVAAGDVNGDGRQDLVTANRVENSVSVLLGDGGGGFAAKTDYATGDSPSSVTAGDFNGDGKRDLAAANINGHSVSVLLGDGSGAFAAKTDYATGSRPSSVTAGDFNGDGKQDLVTANYYGDSVSVLLNRPGVLPGALQFAGSSDYPTGAAPSFVAIGDFNADGQRDLVTANGSANYLSLLLGSAAGTFTQGINYNAGDYSSAVAVGDFDRDGSDDLAIAMALSPQLHIALGNGDGTFGGHGMKTVGTAPSSVVVGDFDRDGNQDVATSNWGSDNVSVLLGNGDGTFVAKVDYATGSCPNSVAVADLNQDGNQDLVTANNLASSVTVLLGLGNGAFGGRLDYSTGFGPSSVAVGDLNGDGRPDVASTNLDSNNVSVLFGNGDGTLGGRVNMDVGEAPNSITRGDFNGDGIQDLVAANTNGNSVSVLLGLGGGVFAAKVDLTTGNDPAFVVHGDFNRDGRQDLATSNWTVNTVSILLNTTMQ